MAKAAFVMSKEMADVERLGALKEQLAALQVEHDKLETRLRKKLGKRFGIHFVLTVYDSMNKTFNYVKAKRLMGAEAYNKCWTENNYRTSRLTKITRSK
jgi:predicted transcriptional regulator